MTTYIEGQKVILKPTSTNPYSAPMRKMGVAQLEVVVSWVISPERFRVDLGELAPQMGLRGDRTEITVLLDATYPDWEVAVAVAEAKPVYPPELSKAAEIAAEYIEFDNAEAAFAFAAENNAELKAELAGGDAAQIKRNFALGFEGHKAQSGGGGWSEMLAARKRRILALAGIEKDAVDTAKAVEGFYSELSDEEADFYDEIAAAVNAVDLKGASVEVMRGYIDPETPDIKCRIVKGDAEAFFYRSDYTKGTAEKLLRYVTDSISDGRPWYWYIEHPHEYVAQRAADERLSQ